MVSVAVKPTEAFIRKGKDDLFIRFPFAEIERDRSFDILEEKFTAYQRENEEADMGTIQLEFTESEGVICHFKNNKGFRQEIPITDKAIDLLFNKYRLGGIGDILNHPNKDDALKLVGQALKLQKSLFTGKTVRFPTAVEAGIRRIIHVQSSRSPELDELVVLQNVRKATAGMNLTPAYARVSANGFKMSLITVSKEMKMSSKGTQGHRIYGEGDTIFPGCHLTLSSTNMANRIESFFFVRACENGSIFGEEAGYDMSIQRNNGVIQAIPQVLGALFKLTLDRAPQTMKVLEDLREEPFIDVPLIESYAREDSLTRVYDQYLKNPLEAMQLEESNRLQSFQLIAEVAHNPDLAPDIQIRLEEMAGKYAYAGKDKVKPPNNYQIASA